MATFVVIDDMGFRSEVDANSFQDAALIQGTADAQVCSGLTFDYSVTDLVTTRRFQVLMSESGPYVSENV